LLQTLIGLTESATSIRSAQRFSLALISTLPIVQRTLGEVGTQWPQGAAINRSALEQVWRPLADKLDVHAYIEEKIFYPQLLKRGADDPEGDTLDAIVDHNDIRDGVRAANAARVGTEQWWAAVGRTRLANDDHMREEEREGLSDFRRYAPIGLREALGQQYSEFMARHPTTIGLPITDRDPNRYVENLEDRSRSKPPDFSLGIGHLKGK
jgi:hypothetical protein